MIADKLAMSKQLRPKTLQSHEQALKLFARWLQDEMGIEDVDDVKEPHIRSYIIDLQKRGKAYILQGLLFVRHRFHRP